jgi:hypothetical protein
MRAFDEIETATEVTDSVALFALTMSAVYLVRKSGTGYLPGKETPDDDSFADDGDDFAGRSRDAGRSCDQDFCGQ